MFRRWSSKQLMGQRKQIHKIAINMSRRSQGRQRCGTREK